MVGLCLKSSFYVQEHLLVNNGLKHLIVSIQRAQELDISRLVEDAINGTLNDVETHLAITVAVLDTILRGVGRACSEMGLKGQLGHEEGRDL